MSYFNKRAESVVDSRRDRQPTYFTGLVIPSSDVIQAALENPWFMSTRQMAPIFGNQAAAVRDSNKEGLSVVGPDYDRPESRKPWTFVGCLMPGIQGTSAGKTTAFASSRKVLNYMHLVANRKETPTGVLIDQRIVPEPPNSNTQFTDMDTAHNNPDASGYSPVQPVVSQGIDPDLNQSNVPRTQTRVVNIDGIVRTETTVSRELPSPLNKTASDIDGEGRVVPTRATNTGSLGSNIQTGTTMIPTTQISWLLDIWGVGVN